MVALSVSDPASVLIISVKYSVIIFRPLKQLYIFNITFAVTTSTLISEN